MLRVCANRSIAGFVNRRQGKLLIQNSSCRIYSSTATSQIRNTSKHLYLSVQAPLAGTLVGCAWKMILPTNSPKTQCEIQVASSVAEKPELVFKISNTKLWEKIKRSLRLIRRVIILMIALSPVAALYPLQYLVGSGKRAEEDAQEVVLASLRQTGIDSPVGWYYRMCLQCVEWSGAATIKMMQWAGSRPDMFGQAFCAVFSQLQDDTTPHLWEHSEKVLREAYGDDWYEKIRLGRILGSGCIAQVYKGVVVDADGNEQELAVKVMHPNVEDDIDADLDIMRLSVRLLEKLPFDVFRNLKWLNLQGFIDEMESMLKIQLDLRTEADHLVRFNENFEDNETVVFPKLVEGYAPTKEVLVETFCEGVPVMEFVRNNNADRELLSQMCRGAIAAVCQMIFLDNFVHGDLHPGNVLISSDLKFVLLDAGIVTEHSEADHRLISDVLAAFIRCQGRKAGRYMIDDSNSRLRVAGDHAVDEEMYIDKIELLTIQAKGKERLMENLGTYISYICNAAAQHHVMLNQAFISAALALKVQEYMALALDPTIEIWRVATPIILEGERRNVLTVKRAKEMLDIEGFIDWVTGGKQ